MENKSFEEKNMHVKKISEHSCVYVRNNYQKGGMCVFSLTRCFCAKNFTWAWKIEMFSPSNFTKISRLKLQSQIIYVLHLTGQLNCPIKVDHNK